jgi:hypothetical protein
MKNEDVETEREGDSKPKHSYGFRFSTGRQSRQSQKPQHFYSLDVGFLCHDD